MNKKKFLCPSRRGRYTFWALFSFFLLLFFVFFLAFPFSCFSILSSFVSFLFFFLFILFFKVLFFFFFKFSPFFSFSFCRELKRSWCGPVPECLVVARTGQYYRGTRRRASNPQHLLFWSSSLEGAMLGGFSFGSRSVRKEVLLQGSACGPCLPLRPPEPRRRTRHSFLKNMPTCHDKPRRKVECARLKRIQGSAWIKSASIRRICVSAAQVKERRQGRRKRAPRWWLAAAKPDFVLGARLGVNWTPPCGTASTRRSATTQMRSDSLGCVDKQISRVHR